MKPSRNKPLKSISKRSYVLLGIYICFSIICFTLSIFPLLSEIAYRKGHVYSTEAKIYNFRYLNRFNYAFKEYERAVKYFPWETHYAMEYIKDLETYALKIKSPSEKKKLFEKALRLTNRIQYIDNINPWFNSKKASILFHLYSLTQNPKYLTQSFHYSRQACYSDYENPIFMLNHANILHQGGKLSEAYYYYDKAISIDSRFPESHFNLADIYTRLNYRSLALNTYLKVKELNPNFQSIDSIILKTYVSLSEFVKGEAYILKYNLYNTKNLKTLETICYYYFVQDKFDTALSYFTLYFSLSKKPIHTLTKEFNRLYIESLTKTGLNNVASDYITTLIETSNESNYFRNLKKSLNL